MTLQEILTTDIQWVNKHASMFEFKKYTLTHFHNELRGDLGPLQLDAYLRFNMGRWTGR